MHKTTVEINKVIALNIDVDDWDKYIGYMASDYRDIWINHYDLEDNDYNDCDFNGLLNKYHIEKELLLNGTVDYIALRADVD